MSHYIRAIRLRREAVPSFSDYPFSIPAIRHLDRLPLDAKVTFFVGENGAGKSTLIEAIAVKWGFNAEGGSQNFRFSTHASHSEDLQKCLILERNPRLRPDGYFLRAESFYTLATEIDRLDGADPGILHSYGGKSLHAQSHGEAFLSLLTRRINGDGLYIFDEPESALSPQRQLSLLVLMDRLVKQGAQLLIATHSPILMAYPLRADLRNRPTRSERHHLRGDRALPNHPQLLEPQRANARPPPHRPAPRRPYSLFNLKLHSDLNADYAYSAFEIVK